MPKVALMTRLERLFPDYHPVIEMARQANDPEVSQELRFAANKEVAKYVTPQLRAIELTGTDGGPLRYEVIIAPHREVAPE